MSTAIPDDFVQLAEELADIAGPIVRSFFRQPFEIHDKSDESPVTVADRTAEAKMREAIATRYPDHGIYGEEHGTEGLDRRFVWVLDPIDGTRAFISGMPVFGTLIALLDHGKPVLGVIDQPVTGERWIGVEGRRTVCNGKPVSTRDCGGLGQATLYATTPEMFTDIEAESFMALRRSLRYLRYGGDCYAYALLSSGFIDLVVESQLQPYDIMALVPVVTGAGGVMSDWKGNPLMLSSGNRVIAAATGALHQEALEILSRTP